MIEDPPTCYKWGKWGSMLCDFQSANLELYLPHLYQVGIGGSSISQAYLLQLVTHTKEYDFDLLYLLQHTLDIDTMSTASTPYNEKFKSCS